MVHYGSLLSWRTEVANSRIRFPTHCDIPQVLNIGSLLIWGPVVCCSSLGEIKTCHRAARQPRCFSMTYPESVMFLRFIITWDAPRRDWAVRLRPNRIAPFCRLDPRPKEIRSFPTPTADYLAMEANVSQNKRFFSGSSHCCAVVEGRSQRLHQDF